MAEVEFPVFVASRDSGEMRKFADLRTLARNLERIDVENREYLAWDRNGRVITMRAGTGNRWLVLEAGESGEEQLREALLRYAGSAGVQATGIGAGATDAEAMFHSVERRVSEVRSKAGWFKRLIRRF